MLFKNIQCHKYTSFPTFILSIFCDLWPSSAVKNYLNYRLRLVASLVMIVLTILLALGLPWTFRSLINEFEGGQPASIILMSAGFYAILILVYYFFWMFEEVVLTKSIYRIAQDIHQKAFEHIQSLSLRYHTEKKSGVLATILSRINFSTFRLISFSCFCFLTMIIEFSVSCTVFSSAYGWRYGIGLVITALVYIGVTKWLLRKFTAVQLQANKAENEAGGHSIDYLNNYKVVKLFAQDQREREHMDQILSQRAQASTRKTNLMLYMFLIHSLLTGICVGGLTLLAVWDAIGGRLTVGDVVLVNSYLIHIFGPFIWLSVVLIDVVEGINHLRQVWQLHQVQPDIKNHPQAKEFVFKGGTIQFEHVYFSYDGRHPLLRDFNLTIPAGRTVGVVGETGAGKSTLSNLICRFYDPQKGDVRIDDQDIRYITLDSLRSIIGVVPQDITLFHQTIRYNLTYGVDTTKGLTVEEAAKLAGIHEAVMAMPAGYETMVGEQGVKLSGGERQRLGIARCLLKEAKILIFDEATSALDTKTERDIQDRLAFAGKGITTLIIAHRLSTIRQADLILVMDKGKIAEQGKHQDLIKLNGFYARLWRQQNVSESDKVKLMVS